MTLPHAICEGLWLSPNPPWSFLDLYIEGQKCALVSSYVDVQEALRRATRAYNLLRDRPRITFSRHLRA